MVTGIAQMERSNMNDNESHQDLADFKSISKEQEDEVLLLELNRLRKKGAINKETFMKTMDEWGI